MTGTPAAASRARSARTFRTWIQIITECPAGPALCPRDLEQSLAEEEHHAGILRDAELPADGQAKYIAVEAAAAVQVAGPQQDPAAQNGHATISASR
jgi:hypothetical protein